MKKTILTAAVCAALLLTACRNDMNGVSELTKHIKPLKIEAAAGNEDFRDAQMQFSMEMLHQAAETYADDNFLISPYLAAEAWLTAANGEPHSANTDCFGGMALSELNGYFVKWRSTQNPKREEDSAYKQSTLTEAQSLWIPESAADTTNKEILELYRGLSDTRVFAADRTPEILNQWVNDATGGAVKTISVPQNNDPAMLTAAAFETIWKNNYSDNEMTNVLFTCTDGTQKTASFLNKDNDTAIYFDNDAVTGIRKSLAGQKYMFLALMPKSGTPAAFLSSLTAEQLTEYIRTGIEINLRTEIPVLDINDTQDITALLPDPAVGQIVQHLSFQIGRGTNEMSYSLTLGESSGEIEGQVVFNRPFVYFIIDRQYGLPLYAGAVNQLPLS